MSAASVSLRHDEPEHEPEQPQPLQKPKMQLFGWYHVNSRTQGWCFFPPGCPTNGCASYLRGPAYIVAFIWPDNSVTVDFLHSGVRSELNGYCLTVAAGRGFGDYATGVITEVAFSFVGFDFAVTVGRPVRRLTLDALYDPGALGDIPLAFSNGENILGYHASYRFDSWATMIRIRPTLDFETLCALVEPFPRFIPQTDGTHEMYMSL
jgi:hypothetical protein